MNRPGIQQEQKSVKETICFRIDVFSVTAFSHAEALFSYTGEKNFAFKNPCNPNSKGSILLSYAIPNFSC